MNWSHAGCISQLFVLTLGMAANAFAQTPPVITGPGGATSAAFWYFRGVGPSCCTSLTNKYYTEWTLSLATNTANPTPTIVWSTNSPGKVLITPLGSTGAQLVATDHSAPGTTYDITISVSVDGVSSANFPVFIDTAWTHTSSSPTAYTCTALFGSGFIGWAGRASNTLRELTNTFNLTPIDVAESFENQKVLYPFTGWGPMSETNWPSYDWASSPANSFYDNYALCYTNIPPNPATTFWNPSGTTAIRSSTQKYWVGSLARMNGQCSLRQAVTFYQDHAATTSQTTTIANQLDCNSGSGFLN